MSLFREYTTKAITVITIIIRRELAPVIIIPNSTCRTMMLSVTVAIDRPKERAILSTIFTRLKKTSVQAKPGTKNTMINPRIALMVGRRSAKGITDSSSWPKSMYLYYSIWETTASIAWG
jgi:hypothetical protein